MVSDAVEIAAALVRRYEGLRLRPYLCPAGVPTIGYGATYYQYGRRVTLWDAPITYAQAEQLMRWMLEKEYVPAVMNLCPTIDTPERLAAIVDFTFNLGIGRLKTSTLRKRILAERWSEVPEQLMKWDKAGGIRLKGLTLRREAECSLIR